MTTRRRIVGALTLLAPAVAGAQSIAARVASAPDGVVRMQYASRDGVCGDGREAVAYGRALFMRNFQSFGRWSGVRCVPGPLRVSITIDGREIVRVRTQVGGDWVRTEERVTDLGDVSAAEASSFFFDLAPRLERTAGKDRILLPAVLADADVVAPLIRLARDDDRAMTLRNQALQWLGLIGDPAAREYLHRVAGDAGEATKFRAHAIFAIANSGDVPASEFAWLRSLYGKLDSEELREAVLQGVAQDESRAGDWVIARALDDSEPVKLRKTALFWAGQRQETPVAELVRAYREAGERSLREHAIFVLSQRSDDAATDALITIAKSDGDMRMREKALFWLAQKDDPRVRKLITDLVLKEP